MGTEAGAKRQHAPSVRGGATIGAHTFHCFDARLPSSEGTLVSQSQDFMPQSRRLYMYMYMYVSVYVYVHTHGEADVGHGVHAPVPWAL